MVYSLYKSLENVISTADLQALTDEFRLEFSIRDRDFNQSNVVITRDLTLDDILVN